MKLTIDYLEEERFSAERSTTAFLCRIPQDFARPARVARRKSGVLVFIVGQRKNDIFG